MNLYVVRRLAQAAATLLGISLLTFGLGRLAPDPAEAIAYRGLQPGEAPTAQQIAEVSHELGLDRPLSVRYVDWLAHAIRGDLGRSLYTQEGVGAAIGRTLPSTIALGATAFIMMVMLAIPLGSLGALFEGRVPEQVLRLLALLGASIPGFFLAYLLVYLFSVRLHLFPVAGEDGIKSVVLPAAALALGPSAIVSRLLQATLVDVLGEDYIRTARGKGLGTFMVVMVHALRNAALPVLTVLGTTLGRLLEGAVVMELIFGRAGIGRLTLGAVASGDYAMLQGVVLFAGLVVILLNLLVDLAYPRVDPRVRLGAAS